MTHALHIGFTGTRKGMNPGQKNWLSFHVGGLCAMMEWDTLWFHHGDCTGADSEAHDIMKELGFKIHVHPPSDDRYRAFRKGDVMEKSFPYMRRNYSIVHSSDVMFACPAQNKEVLRSGTWATIRYTRKFPKKVLTVISR